MNAISTHSTLVNLFHKDSKSPKAADERCACPDEMLCEPLVGTKKIQRNSSDSSLYTDKLGVSDDTHFGNKTVQMENTEDNREGKRYQEIKPPLQKSNKEKEKSTPLKCRLFSAFHRIPNTTFFKPNVHLTTDICTIKPSRPNTQNLRADQLNTKVGGSNKMTHKSKKAISVKKSKSTIEADLQESCATLEKNVIHLQTLNLNLPKTIPSKIRSKNLSTLLQKINDKSLHSIKNTKRPDTTHSITLQLQIPGESHTKKPFLPTMKEPFNKTKNKPAVELSHSKVSMAEILSTILPPTVEKAGRPKKSTNIQKKKQSESCKKTHAFLIAESTVAKSEFEDIQTIQLDLLNPEKPGKSEFKAVELTKPAVDTTSKLPPLKLQKGSEAQAQFRNTPYPRKQQIKKSDCVNTIFRETENEDLNGEYIDIGPWNK
ncbi:hypothetical protein HDV01_004074 [Terramyces sp. JEL0728]|nr:hypothetical protein HDV01_004074 [Terramyces sp. JEL0728]